MEIGSGYYRLLDKLGNAGGKLQAGVASGLEEGGQYAAGIVVSDYLSGQYLNRRTGSLAKDVTSWMEGLNSVSIGVPADSPSSDHAWLLTDEEKTITPKKGKFLTIPIGENLTGSGVPKFFSPRDYEAKGSGSPGFFLTSKSGSLFFGYKRGKKGKFRPLFVLVKSVFVQGTGALFDGVNDSIDVIADTIEQSIITTLDVQ